MIKSFEDLFSVKKNTEKKTVVVACANDDHTLKAISAVTKTENIHTILVGDAAVLKESLADYGLEEAEVVDAADQQAAVETAVSLCKAGRGDVLVKGLVETAVILRRVVNKENGLCAQGVLSHLTVTQLPNYHKLLGVTDCALLMYPTLDQKKEEIRNSVRFLTALGIAPVKTAVLAAIEKVNPKMPETVDANALKEWYQSGAITDCIVEGPISYDLAMRPGAAKVKGFDSQVAGDPDLLVVPNITVGNVLIKALTCSAGGISAALILGATVPIVVTSRSSSVQTKVTSIRMALSI